MTLTQSQINEKMVELNSMLELAKEAEAAAEAIKDSLKEHMNETGQLELLDTEHGFKCTFRETIANRFDSTSFKKVHADLYQAFVTKTSYRRFTFK